MNHKFIKLILTSLLIFTSLSLVNAEGDDNLDNSPLPSITEVPISTIEPPILDEQNLINNSTITVTPGVTVTPNSTDTPGAIDTPYFIDAPNTTDSTFSQVEWEINSVDDLTKLANVINYYNEEELPDYNVIVNKDLNIKETNINLPIFKGTFDGKGHTITLNNQALFNKVIEKNDDSNTIIKNINLSGLNNNYTSKSSIVGVLANEVSGASIENCHVFDSEINNQYINPINDYEKSYIGNFTGGLVGRVNDNKSTFNNITTDVNIINTSDSSTYSGGIVGYASDNISISECTFKGNIKNGTYIGGIIGYTERNVNISKSINQSIIENATQYGSHGGFAGGIIGYAYDGIIDNCYNSGTITTSERSGGIAGGGSSLEINKCINAGTVKAIAIAGGIVGILEDNSSLNSSMNIGDVYSNNINGGIAGGLIGKLTDSSFFKSYSIANKIEANIRNGLVGKAEEDTAFNGYFINPNYELANQYNGSTTITSLINRNSNEIREFDDGSTWTLGYGILPRMKEFLNPSLAFALSIPKEVVDDEYQLTFIESIEEYKVNGEEFESIIVQNDTIITYKYGDNDEVVLPIPESAIGKRLNAKMNNIHYGFTEERIELTYYMSYDSNNNVNLNERLQVKLNEDILEAINDQLAVTYEILSNELEGLTLTNNGDCLDFSNVKGVNNTVGNYELILKITDKHSLLTYQNSIIINIIPYILNREVVSLTNDSISYNGKPIEVAMNIPKIIGTNTDAFNLDQDYTLKYFNNVNAGEATVRFEVIDKNNIVIRDADNENVDFLEFTFTIDPFDLKDYPNYFNETIVENIEETVIYKYNNERPQKNIKELLSDINKISIINDIDIIQQEKANTDIGSGGVVTIIMIPKADNKNVIGELTYKYNIIAREIDETCFVITNDTDLIYTGKKHTIDIKPLLVSPEYYDVRYNERINAGETSVIISANNAYTKGSYTHNFTINAKEITKEDFTVDNNNEVYSSKEIHKNIISKLDKSNYEITYTNNINEGNALITITGKNNYKNSINYNFNITSRQLRKEDFIFDPTGVVYTGLPINKSLTSPFLNENDYMVTYTNNISLGEVTMTVKSKNDNAKGSLEYKFDIQISGSIPNGTTFDLESNKRYSSKDAFNILEDGVTYQGNINFYVDPSSRITMEKVN